MREGTSGEREKQTQRYRETERDGETEKRNGLMNSWNGTFYYSCGRPTFYHLQDRELGKPLYSVPICGWTFWNPKKPNQEVWCKKTEKTAQLSSRREWSCTVLARILKPGPWGPEATAHIREGKGGALYSVTESDTNSCCKHPWDTPKNSVSPAIWHAKLTITSILVLPNGRILLKKQMIYSMEWMNCILFIHLLANGH